MPGLMLGRAHASNDTFMLLNQLKAVQVLQRTRLGKANIVGKKYVGNIIFVLSKM